MNIRPLLDLIGRAEAAGNYDAAYGNARSAEPLERFTLDEILQKQDAMVANGSPSSAIGRYQFIRGTLRSLKERMGLSGSVRFTPELQDRLAIELLRGRGLGQWERGVMDDLGFGNALAREWASLPVLTRQRGSKIMVEPGQSYYAGDGLNKALVSPEEVLSCIAACKWSKPEISEPAPKPATGFWAWLKGLFS